MSSYRNPFRSLSALIVAALVGVGMLGAPGQAKADFAIRFSTDGGATWNTVTDDVGAATQSPFGDFNPLAGYITAFFNGFTITASANASTSPMDSLMDLAVSGSPAGPYDFKLQATLTGLVTEPAPQTLHYRFTGSVLPSGSAVQMFQTWVDDDDGLFATTGGGIVANTGSISLPAGGGMASGNIQFTADVYYSMTTEVRVKYDGTGKPSLSNDSNNEITPAPAPAAIMLVISGVPVMWLGMWFRRRPLLTVA